MNENAPTLTMWSLVKLPHCELDVYSAPELMSTVAHGTVTGHPTRRDNTDIHTSLVQWIDVKRMTMQTQSRMYKLGDMADGYRLFLEKDGRDSSYALLGKYPLLFVYPNGSL